MSQVLPCAAYNFRFALRVSVMFRCVEPKKNEKLNKHAVSTKQTMAEGGVGLFLKEKRTTSLQNSLFEHNAKSKF